MPLFSEPSTGHKSQRKSAQYSNQAEKRKATQQQRIEIISPLIIHRMGHP